MPSTRVLFGAPAGLVAAAALSIVGLVNAAPASGATSLCPVATVTVSTSAQLHLALDKAVPGDVIVLKDGVYNGKFVAHNPGTAAKPVTLCGSRSAILNAEGPSGGYVLHLKNADYWRVQGLTARHGQKGIMLDETDYAVLSGVEVYDTGDEAIHLRGFSSHNLVTGVVVHDTGKRNTKFGEGIYIGSATSNWGTVSGGVPDASDFNVIEKSTIYATTAESVDIKEGTQGGIVRNNSFDGAAIVESGADSWVDAKGRDWIIVGNTGVNSPRDGFQTHEILSGWGTGNVFRNNTADVNGPGVGFSLTPVRANVVECSNVVTDAANGYSNVKCVGAAPTEPTPTEPTPTEPTPTPGTAATCEAPSITVRTAAELTSALSSAVAGDAIAVAPGTYKGEFRTKAKGTSVRPILLCGEGAVLVGDGISGGEVLSFYKAASWRVSGLALREGQTGLEVRASQDIIVTDVTVSTIGDEGVLVRSESVGTSLSNISVTDVGLRKASKGYAYVVDTSTATSICGGTITNAPSGAIKLVSGATVSVTS